jgi:hypothetical protein
MKMHEYQNKGVTRKAIRKLLKRKKCTYGCSEAGKDGGELFRMKLRGNSQAEE